MPNRILKDSIRTSVSLSHLTAEEERHFYRLLVQADDFGCFQAHPSIMRANGYALMLDKITDAQVEAWTLALVREGILHLYEANGKRYAHFANWDKYQTRRGQPARKFPIPDCSTSCSALLPITSDYSALLPITQPLLPISPSETETETETKTLERGAKAPSPPKDESKVKKRVVVEGVPLTEEHIKKLIALHADHWPESEVRERIEEALNYVTAAKRPNKYLYVRGWLRNDAQRNGGNNGATNIRKSGSNPTPYKESKPYPVYRIPEGQPLLGR